MKKNVLIGIGGGIAGYKIIDLIKLLKKDSHDVSVIMTKGAEAMFPKKEFEKVLGKKIMTDLFDKDFDYKKVLKNRQVEHIRVADQADVMVIAPATANILAKLAYGIADDLLTTTVLAMTAPIIICPSMNVNMWNNPIVQDNLKKLEDAGYQMIKPTAGMLACGYEGVGRLENVEIINKEIKKLFSKTNSLSGKKIIVTAGGTIEKIDDVRFIANRGSGRMGAAIAEECYLRGADVLLLRSKNSVRSRYLIKEKIFQTAEDLDQLVKENIEDVDIFFQTAAVSDYKLEKFFTGKLSSNKPLNLKLVPQVKIVNQIKKLSPKTLLVAFKAEYGLSEKQLIKEGIKKLIESQADIVVANDISRTDRGFESDDNEVFIIKKNKQAQKISLTSKREVARHILESLNIK